MAARTRISFSFLLVFLLTVGMLTFAPGAGARQAAASTQIATSGGPVASSVRSSTVPGPGVSTSSSPLSVGKPVLLPLALDSGARLNLSLNISGGLRPYNITWLGLPSGCVSQNKTSFHCFPGAPSGEPTTSEVSVLVTDSNGMSNTSTSSPVTVNPLPSVAVSTITSAGVPPFWGNFTAVTYYGTAPFRFFWNFGGASNATGQSVTHEFTAVGTFVVTVWANDSSGTNVSGFLRLRSVGPLVTTLAVSPSSPVDPGASITFVASVQGGLSPYSYSWAGLPSFCAPVTEPNQSSVSCSGATSGSYTVSVAVIDSLLHSANATVTVSVSAPVSVWEVVTFVFVGAAVVLAVVICLMLVRPRSANGS